MAALVILIKYRFLYQIPLWWIPAAWLLGVIVALLGLILFYTWKDESEEKSDD